MASDNQGNSDGPTQGPWGKPGGKSGGRKTGSGKGNGSNPWGGSRGNGPGGNGGGGHNPWGAGSGGSGGQPPDIEELLRRGQDQFRNAMPPSVLGPQGIIVLLILMLAVWLFSGIYRVKEGERGMELVFGEFTSENRPGLHYNWPTPIGSVVKVNVNRINRIEVGFFTYADARSRARTEGKKDVPDESLMLTGDENIIDIDFLVNWQVIIPKDYLFEIRDPESTIKRVAESAMREVIGRSKIQNALTKGRDSIEDKAQEILQSQLDEYKAGVKILQLELQEVSPPEQVIDAFNDVIAAGQDQERLINEAQAYENAIIPEARGEAAQLEAEAEAYKAEVVNRATGDANRFISVMNAWRLAKGVTTQRLYLETMEQIMKNANKVIIDGESGGVVPYLPLNELKGKGAQ